MPTALGVIPVRYASTRFPGKPLVPLHDGRTLLETVWTRATGARAIERWIVATDDERIERECERLGAECMRTSGDHPSGTDRVAEVARRVETPHDVVVNLQGDEPLVTTTALDRLVAAFDGAPALEMATLCEPIQGPEAAAELASPDVVKVVRALDGRALYFSRSPIPHGPAESGETLRHQGIYAYRPDCLERLTRLDPTPLERRERLEQLRALEHGIGIRVLDSDFRSEGVDTPADLDRVRRILEETANAR